MIKWLIKIFSKKTLNDPICYHCAIKNGADPTIAYLASMGYCNYCQVKTWVTERDEFFPDDI